MLILAQLESLEVLHLSIVVYELMLFPISGVFFSFLFKPLFVSSVSAIGADALHGFKDVMRWRQPAGQGSCWLFKLATIVVDQDRVLDRGNHA